LQQDGYLQPVAAAPEADEPTTKVSESVALEVAMPEASEAMADVSKAAEPETSSHTCNRYLSELGELTL
jgi:hypothetical protein